MNAFGSFLYFWFLKGNSVIKWTNDDRPTNPRPRPSPSAGSSGGEAAEARALRASALYGAGLRLLLRPSLRPVLGSTSLRGISRRLSKGGVPPLRPPHAVHPPIESELPHPFPSHQARWGIQAEESGREIGRENPTVVVGGFCSPRAARPRSRTLSNVVRVTALSVKNGVRRVGSGEDGGGECVDGGVVV